MTGSLLVQRHEEVSVYGYCPRMAIEGQDNETKQTDRKQYLSIKLKNQYVHIRPVILVDLGAWPKTNCNRKFLICIHCRKGPVIT